MFVTLEPCNHVGRTGPCTKALLESSLREIIIGVRDPNPDVTGGGAAALQRAEVHVMALSLVPEREACERLIEPFRKLTTVRRPWVTLKTAHQNRELWSSMVPPVGSVTFTSHEGLVLAHSLRKRADAIITGSGTVLADIPRFTVRHVADHEGKRRFLVVLDRRKRVPESWWDGAFLRGFDRVEAGSINEALDELGRRGCLEVLVEAGPTLSKTVDELDLWDEWVRIYQDGEGECSQELLKNVDSFER